MNDRPPAQPAAIFDPAAHGWEQIVNHTAFGDLVGPIWKREDGAQLRFGFVVAAKHLNHSGNLHGGMLTTLADQAMGMTARHVVGSKRHATIDLNIQFIGAVRLGQFVEAHPVVVPATRSLVFMNVKMFVGSNLVVTASGIWKILERG